MNEPKPLASLSPALLARKGQARPAMRPQTYTPLEDLGWNDMGREVGGSPVIAPMPEVARRQAQTAEQFAAAMPGHAAPDDGVASLMAVTSRAGGQGKAAFTLRLDADRHYRLRLACALRRRSAQRIVIDVLDAFLETVPGLDTLAGAVPVAAPGPDRKIKQEV